MVSNKAPLQRFDADSGEFEGLVSGGCLEDDLAAHAGKVIEMGKARVVTCDLIAACMRGLSPACSCIVMSHHLTTDRSYLSVLSRSLVPYIGLLGPAGWLHGPAGLDIGADSPESIALSILAEIHALSRARG